jgi:hypothetical protein
MHRVIAVALVVLALALGLVVVRTWYASRDEWQAAETLVAQYNRLPRVTAASREEGRDRRAELLRDAIIRYREAALWYLPANPYVRRSIERLLLIGQRAEQAADDRLALYAYRAARSAVLGTRTFFVNDEEGLQRADVGIARVSARIERPAPPGEEAVPSAERERRQLALLAPQQGPDPWLALLAAAGLLLWIGGVVGFALRGLDEHCRVLTVPALWAAGVIVCGLAAWVAGLALA